VLHPYVALDGHDLDPLEQVHVHEDDDSILKQVFVDSPHGIPEDEQLFVHFTTVLLQL
jgi:hypothetical protein